MVNRTTSAVLIAVPFLVTGPVLAQSTEDSDGTDVGPIVTDRSTGWSKRVWRSEFHTDRTIAKRNTRSADSYP